MEQWFRFGFRSENIPGYNCAVVNKTVEDWYAEGVVNYPLGISFLLYGISVQVVYIFILSSMWRLQKTNACYKIMFLLGLFDISNLAVNSNISGYFWLLGACYCTHPNLNYVAGSIGVAVWCGACFCCLILVINRTVDLWNSQWSEQLFGGKRIYIWLSAPIFYTIYFLFFTYPIIFSSKLTAWFFAPLILGIAEEMGEFHNYSHTFNNLGVVLIICMLYLTLILTLRYKYAIGGANISKSQRSIMIQSLLICSASLVGSIIYVYMQFFPIPTWVILAGHMCWQASQGIPAFVYLALNGTIRRDVLKTLGLTRFVRIGPSTNSKSGMVASRSTPITLLNLSK